MKNWAFIEHVTDQLDRSRPGDSKHPTLWPSEASATYKDQEGNTVVAGKCRRAVFFRYLIECFKFYDKYKMWSPLVNDLRTNAKKVDRYMLWIWAQGNLYEDFLINQAKDSGIFAHSQVPIYIKSHNISGKTDVEVYNPETRKLSIVEAKSVYGFGGNVVLGTPGDRTKGQMGTPRESNLMQIALYNWWRASTDDAYEYSRLVYGSRDTGRYAEYLVRTVLEGEVIHIEYRAWAPVMCEWVRSPITINSILDEYLNVQRDIDGGTIPPRDFILKWNQEQIDAAAAAGKLTKTDQKQYDKIAEQNKVNAYLQTIIDAAKSGDASEIATAISPSGPSTKEVLAAKSLSAPLIKRYLDYLDVAEVKDGQSKKDIAVISKFIAAAQELTTKHPLKPIVRGDWQCRFCKWAGTCYDKDSNPREVK